GRAVVRIDDPNGGREGYTFDLLWNGGNGGPAFGQPDYRDRNWQNRDVDRNYRDRSEINFNGRGDGYLRNRWRDDHIRDANVTVRYNDIQVVFRTDRGSSIYLTGRIMNREGDRLVAQMS